MNMVAFVLLELLPTTLKLHLASDSDFSMDVSDIVLAIRGSSVASIMIMASLILSN